ncbi:MAG: T9SS type A sorting domain-containing protein [Chitinophagaceae bacterium]
MKTKTLKIVLSIVVLFFSFNLKATHILNGDFDARIYKTSPDSVTYGISLTVRAMCDSVSIRLPDNLIVCVYDANSGALVKSGLLLKYDQYKISNCVGFCVTNVQYYLTLTVAKRDMFIIKTEICCRKSLTNLRNDVNGAPYIGHMFYLKLGSNINIPGTQVELPGLYNLNPGIADTVKYYINDTYADSISVTKVSPFSGASASNNYPSCGSSYMASNIGPIDYSNGYSYQFPFGNQGTFNVDTASSQLVMMSPVKGEFAAALRFAFFKKGVLYFETIKEIHAVVSDYVLNNSNQATLSAAALPFPLARLNWSICPKNISNVTLEKSESDNTNFYERATVGLGYFKLDDMDVGYGRVYYYRLKIFTSTDSFYSNEVKVTFFNKSVSDIESLKIKVAPNPFSDFIELTAEVPLNMVKIYSVNGKLLKQLSIDTNTTSIAVGDLSSGFYIAECTTQDGRVKRIKLQKN